MQHDQVEQQRRHITQIKQVVQHVQHEHIIQRHDEHVLVVQHEVIVHDEQRKRHVQAEQQVMDEHEQ